jgi:hypothetical protein
MAKTPSTPAGKNSKGVPPVKKERFKSLKQMAQVFSLTREHDPSIVWRMALVALLGIGIWIGIGYFVGVKNVAGWVVWSITSLFAGAIGAMLVLARRANKMQYEMLDGQPGASAAILNSIRRGWYTTPAVAVNRNQELVTRTVGRAGVVLVLEGQTPSAQQLLSAEHKRTQRIVGEIPVTDFTIGDGPGYVTLRKLNRAVTKLPKVISQSEARDLNKRLAAIQQAPVGIPKGPLPKGAKLPKMPKG